jgi:starvation-inducible DNA-binding protein
MNVNIGIDLQARKETAQAMARLLADTYTLYLTTHKYHWNVTGPMFQALHTLFEAQYTEMATAVDELAERIRTLGEKAPGSYQEFLALSSVKEDAGFPSATEMIERLVHSHETLIATARETLGVANRNGDDGSADLATQRLQLHEKTAWMLRSFLD